jgi:tetratricopeptide (TPR) repeat protein
MLENDKSQLPKAIKHTMKALEIAQKQENKELETQSLLSLAIAYTHLDEYHKAIDLFRSVILSNFENENTHLYCSYKIALLSFQVGEYWRAWDLAVNIAARLQSKEIPAPINKQEMIEEMKGLIDRIFQLSLDSFIQTQSKNNMKITLKKFPMLSDPKVLGFIRSNKRNAPANIKKEIDTKIEWIEHLTKKKQPGFLGRFLGK